MADQLLGNIRHNGSTFVERRDSSTVSECHNTCSRNIFRERFHRPIMLCIEVGPCALRVAREPVDRNDAFKDTLENGLALVSPDLLNKSGAIVVRSMKHSEPDWRVLQ